MKILAGKAYACTSLNDAVPHLIAKRLVDRLTSAAVFLPLFINTQASVTQASVIRKGITGLKPGMAPPPLSPDAPRAVTADRGIDTIIVNGGNIEIGIAGTCHASQSLDLNVVVVSNGCNSMREDCRQVFMHRIFPLIGRVRMTHQPLEMLMAGAGPT